MPFIVIYHPDVVKTDSPRLPKTMKARIRTAIENRLAAESASYGKPLRHSLHSLWSSRVGDYRVIYQIKNNEVIILKIGNRRDVYKQRLKAGTGTA